jgi:hypothetical protein
VTRPQHRHEVAWERYLLDHSGEGPFGGVSVLLPDDSGELRWWCDSPDWPDSVADDLAEEYAAIVDARTRANAMPERATGRPAVRCP